MPTPGQPLSFAQQRLWFLDQLSPGLAFYTIPIVLDLHGPLDVEALKSAIAEIVRRHEPLRTVFAAADGRPAQVVLPHVTLDCPLHDFSTLPTEEAASVADEHVHREICRPFNLGTGPVIRTSLCRLQSTHHVLAVAAHHICMDGWSVGVFFRELAAIYGAYEAGTASPLPDVATRYSEVATRQRHELAGERFERQMAYWKEQLHLPLPRLALPTDRPRTPTAGTATRPFSPIR